MFLVNINCQSIFVKYLNNWINELNSHIFQINYYSDSYSFIISYSEGFLLVKLKSSLRKFYGSHHDLLQMTMDMVRFSVITIQSFPRS